MSTRLLLVNPNTSPQVTTQVHAAAEAIAFPMTTIFSCNALSGPRVIEGAYDEVLSAQGTLAAVIPLLTESDGIILACYSDHPVLYALREITDKPVLGIAEASMYMACMVGRTFGIVTTNSVWEPLLWSAVRRYGLAERCASIRATGKGGMALKALPREQVLERIAATARQVTDDGADVICLGGAVMSGLDRELAVELTVPVLDGVACAVKLMEGLLAYGLHTSKRGAYRYPATKELVNLSELFQTPYSS